MSPLTAAVGAAVATVLILAGAAHAAAYPPRPNNKYFQSMYYNPTRPAGRQFSFGAPLNASDQEVASIAANNNGMNVSGWNGIYVAIRKNYLASQEAAMVGYFAAGYAEGFVTAVDIYNNWYDLEVEHLFANFSNYTAKWLEDHIAYMRENAAARSGEPYWGQVARVLAQLDGMVQGYNESPESPRLLGFNDIFMINFAFEIYDVIAAADHVNGIPTPPALLRKKHLRARHCSAIVKWTPQNVFMAHNTWSSFETMLRQFKTYEFERSISMSGYPGTIHSGDDFYILNNDLAIQETTNDNWNVSSFSLVVPQSVSEFIRVMVAHAVASTSRQWTEVFCMENSGTYNNQFQIVNMSAFTVNASSLPAEFLWIVEQMPGQCVAADMTGSINDAGYWASYNRPAFPQIFVSSGFAHMQAQYGEYFSHDNCPRAKIFRREHAHLGSAADVQALMRNCNFTLDPYSRVENCTGAPNGVCEPVWSATNVIAARGDLNPANGNWGHMTQFVGQENLAAIDAKLIAASDYKRMTSDIVSGPTADGVEPFRFSTSPFASLPHLGIPDLVHFNWSRSDRMFDGVPFPPPVKPLPSAAISSFYATVTSMSNAEFHDLVRRIVSGGAIVIFDATQTGGNRTSFNFAFVGSGAQYFVDYLYSLSPGKLEQYGVLALASVPVTPQPTAAPPTAAPVNDNSSRPYWIIGVVIAGVALLGIAAVYVYRGGRSGRRDYLTVDDRDIKMV